MKINYFKFFIVKFILIYIIISNYYIIDYKFIDINNTMEYNDNYQFVIIQKKIKISHRGLMSYYYHNLGCVAEYLTKGYIPVVDMASHPNIFNGFHANKSSNPWEIFFYQPFKLKLLIKRQTKIILLDNFLKIKKLLDIILIFS